MWATEFWPAGRARRRVPVSVRIRDAAENHSQFFNPQAPLEITQTDFSIDSSIANILLNSEFLNRVTLQSHR
jgi:hypothetical protein